ncbi:sugar phosphate nucleotidyltransferase [Paenibacillus naphthalenovorans]|uniref:sugar phosphate nucleotidyltransferase n=1 Tax=Paenibacillus naphthalenovorans TaxID=162209 RepID=UPI003D27E189
MKLVLLSGGSGKRLWPLSNDSRSKQFLKVLKNSNQELESMVQRVWGQISAAGLSNQSYIITGLGQVEMIYSQLGHEVNVVCEPNRRDTFPAIALMATYLYSIVGVSLQEVITVLPVDPYVEGHFFHKVKELESIVHDSGADIALMGVKPTYPSEKYGYIVPDKSQNEVLTPYRTVDHFREKPHEDQAKLLIEQGALWNCGVFAFRLDYVINMLIQRGLPIQYEELVKHYDALPKLSFDYEVVEKAKHIVVAPYDGFWKDLGTWNTLTEEIETQQIGSGIISADSKNTHLINELEIPVTIIGCSNLVVAVSPDGILVSDKSASAKIKEIMKDIEQRPMFEERRWGWYRVLDYTKKDGKEVLTKRIGVHAGKNLSYQLHLKRSEAWTIISGEGELVLNDKLIHVAAGDVIQIPVRARHSIRAITDLEIIEVQYGNELVEEDIVRLYMNWADIERQCVKMS